MIGVTTSWDGEKKRPKVKWFKLKDGEKRRIAVTSNQIVIYKAHFYNGRPYLCTGTEHGCELCAMTGRYGTLNHLLNIFDFEDKENEVWGFRVRVFNQVKERKEDNGGLEKITLTVKREGSGEKDTTYDVGSVSRNDREKAMESLFAPINLEELVPSIYGVEAKPDAERQDERPVVKVEDNDAIDEFYNDSDVDNLL